MATAGHSEAVEYLVDRGADPNAQDVQGYTPAIYVWAATLGPGPMQCNALARPAKLYAMMVVLCRRDRAGTS
jgi:hypothetical protein